jgi:predicted phage baseplate assembly protein
MSLSRDPSLRNLDDCGCCQGVRVETPAAIGNRPGLSAIAYRAGTHASFKESLVAALSGGRGSALRGFSAREEDFSIALLDAWAAVGDVLTFYQERIANESYLSTATERLSVRELARSIGYELNPGVAASTWLAFSLEDAPGSPERVTIAAHTRVQSLPGPDENPQTFETIEKIEARPAWNALRPRMSEPGLSAQELYLEGVATGLRPGDHVLIVGSDQQDFRRLNQVVTDQKAGTTKIAWAEGLASTDSGDVHIYTFGRTAGVFGNNAPDWRTMPESVQNSFPVDDAADSADDRANYAAEPDDGRANWPRFSLNGIRSAAGDEGEDTIYLDALYPDIVEGSWVVLSTAAKKRVFKVHAVDEVALADFTLTAKVTRLTLEGQDLDDFNKHVRDLLVYAQSEPLEMAETPISEPVEGAEVVLEGVVEGLKPGRTLLVQGRCIPAEEEAVSVSAGEDRVTEVVTLREFSDDGLPTTLTFAEPLRNRYHRADIRILANVAEATHGELVAETLGSSDAGRPHQRFPLRDGPLTYIPANTASGGESTLEVRVNDLRWEEVRTLYGRTASEHVYATRHDENGVAVLFGDGRSGARPASGSENVQATYRKGTGREGNVRAGQLSLLMTRPLGVSGVANPIRATGGTDPEDLADARENAPLTVLTLDRIVSLSDYEDFARGFAGVSKALASWIWKGDGRAVFLTVAGPEGDEIPEDGPVQTRLLEAIRKAGDALIPVRIRSYAPVHFHLAAHVRRDPAHLAEKVQAAVEAALRDHFSFARRSFGQSVAASEVIAVIEQVPGVTAVHLKALHVVGDDIISQALLTARAPHAGKDASSLDEGAQLLTLELRHGDIEVVS